MYCTHSVAHRWDRRVEERFHDFLVAPAPDSRVDDHFPVRAALLTSENTPNFVALLDQSENLNSNPIPRVCVCARARLVWFTQQWYLPVPPLQYCIWLDTVRRCASVPYFQIQNYRSTHSIISMPTRYHRRVERMLILVALDDYNFEYSISIYSSSQNFPSRTRICVCVRAHKVTLVCRVRPVRVQICVERERIW